MNTIMEYSPTVSPEAEIDRQLEALVMRLVSGEISEAELKEYGELQERRSHLMIPDILKQRDARRAGVRTGHFVARGWRGTKLMPS